MPKLKLKDRTITPADTFVVAEIGSNHMGDFDLCREMVREAARCGADAVKLQKRDNKAMFTDEAYNAPYDNELSYGKTYGEHREHLDWFGVDEFREFQRIAAEEDVLLFATPFEEASARFLEDLDMPLYKIASCDVTNRPLLQAVAKIGKPMIISTGGALLHEIVNAARTVNKINKNFAVLHCVSTYPNQDHELEMWAMRNILEVTGKLGGFSSHHSGLLPHYLARAMGGTIFEAHFTMDRGQRGTDHGFSLEPKGLAQLCQDLPRIAIMRGTSKTLTREAEQGGFIVKMGKGYYAQWDITEGDTISSRDVMVRAPGGGIPLSADIVGMKAARNIARGELLMPGAVQP